MAHRTRPIVEPRGPALEIVHSEGIGQVARDTAATVARLKAREPDALVYLGFGLPGIEMNGALGVIGWDPSGLALGRSVEALSTVSEP